MNTSSSLSAQLTALLHPLQPYIHLPPRLHHLLSPLLSHLPSTLNLSLAPLLALADFTLIASRTIQTGTSSLLDSFILCPGLHKQSTAPLLNNGEYPATAALTSGYVFRTENQAVVHFFQRVGVTGSLVTLAVEPPEKEGGRAMGKLKELVFGPLGLESVHLLLAVFTLDVVAGCVVIRDYYAAAFVLMLVLSRILNVIAIRRRLAPEWHGASEPGIRGDLLVLLSQDRWIRIKGLVDDLKAVTSGQWLRDPGFIEQGLVDVGTGLVYAGVVVGSNASTLGSVMVSVLLLGSAVALGLAMGRGGRMMHMHGRVVKVVGEKKYERRRVLADELIKETGRDDWALQMGMIVGKEKGVKEVIM